MPACFQRYMIGHTFPLFSVSSDTAMSSYLYIVKSELPLVIQAFLNAESDSEWVLSALCNINISAATERHSTSARCPAQTLCARSRFLAEYVGSKYIHFAPFIDSVGVGVWWERQPVIGCAAGGPWSGTICQLCRHTTSTPQRCQRRAVFTSESSHRHSRCA